MMRVVVGMMGFDGHSGRIDNRIRDTHRDVETIQAGRVRVGATDIGGDVKKGVVSVRDLHRREMIQESLELGEVDSRGQESSGGGSVHRVVHEVEGTTDKGGEAPSHGHHIVHEFALDHVLVGSSEEIAVEDHKRLVRSVNRGILPALNVTTTLWERDI